jgi:hypothetical protein
MAMDVLNAMFSKADVSGLLTPLMARAMKFKLFLYVDDLVIFLAPVQQDARVVCAMLELFTLSSVLCTNISKCMLTPIRCSDEEIALVQQIFPC